MSKTFLIFAVFLFSQSWCSFAHAVEAIPETTGTVVNDSTASEEETSYFYPQPISISPSFSFPSYVFSLSVLDSSAINNKIKNIDYSPPPGTEATLRLAYGDLGLSYTRPLPQSSSSKKSYGQNSYSDWKLEFARDRFAAVVFLQRYDGFYTDLNGNTGNYVRSGVDSDSADDFSAPSATSKPQDILKRPDIQSRNFGAITYYAFALFSDQTDAFLIAFRSQDEKNQTAGWDLNALANLSYNKAHVAADAALIPQKKEQLFGASSNLREIEMHSVGSAAGLATSYVFSGARTQLHGIFLIGAGFQRQLTVFGNDRQWKNALANNTHLKFGASRNGKRHSFNVYLNVDNWSAKTKNLRFNSSNLGVELGYSLKI